jgi:PAS domain S-box-containing protein
MESEARYHAIVEAFEGLIYICSKDYRIEFMNQRLIERTGRDATGEYCYKALHDLESVCPWCVNEEVLKGKIVRWEVQSPKDNNWYYIVNTPIHHSNGSLSKMAMIIDITERKRTEEVLKTSEEEKTLILDSTSDLVVYHDKDMRVLWANQMAAVSVGETSGSLKGRYCYEIWHQRAEPCIGCPVLLSRDTGQPQEAEIASPDGRYWFIRGYPIKNTQGEIVALAEFCLDITERKRANEKLKESEKKYKDLSDLLPQVVFEIDTQGNIMFVNRNAFEVFGYTEDDFLKGLNALDMFVPEDKESVLENIQRRLSGEKFGSTEYTAVRKDGTKIPVLIDASPIICENITVGLRGIVIDIAERKQIENELRASEERFRALYENNPSMYFTVDTKGIVLSVNKFGSQQLGYTVEELVGKSVLNIFYPDDKAAVSMHMAECLKEPGKVFIWELRKVRKDGSTLWVRETVRALQWIDGRIVVFIVCEDINELKKAHEALRESEQKYKSLTERSLTGIYIHQDGKYVFVNKQFAEIHGYEPEELIGEDYLSLIYKGDREAARNRVEKRLAGEDISFRYELRRINKDGRILWTEVVATVIQYKGKPAIMGNIIDISKRKQAEAEVQTRIKELEEFYDIAVGREVKMSNLNREIEKLKEELKKYKKE